jgi:hypothetical protein
MITIVVCGTGINGTDDGTNVIGIATGDGGNKCVDGKSRFGIILGLIGVGTGTMNDVGTVDGTDQIETITAVVPGIVTYSTVDGTNVPGIMTGDGGK